MKAELKEKLHGYIVENNPELMLNQQSSFSMPKYLEEKVSAIQPMLDKLIAESKPGYIIEELCMNELTQDLRPSRYNYIKEVLETEFEETFKQFRESGVLTYEIVNMIHACDPVFEQMGFSEDRAEDRKLRYAITGTVKEYLQQA